MEFNQKVKEELEGRIKTLEDFIAENGIGSKQLSKVKKAQRDGNLAVFLGGLITIAGITIWAISRNSNDDNE
jgi:hypothetical protein